MNEQRCGTCRYYEPEPQPDEIGDPGFCSWVEGRALPPYLEDTAWEVYATDGRSCQCWRAQENQDAA